MRSQRVWTGEPSPPARNGTVTLWDVASRSLLRGPFDVASGRVEGMSFNADETMLATAGPNGVRLWDVATGAARGRVGDGSAVGAVAFSPAAPLVAIVTAGIRIGEQGGVVEIWDTTQRSPGPRSCDRRCQDVLGYALAFTPDGRVLASGGLGDRFVHLWDVEKEGLLPGSSRTWAACTRSSSARTVAPWRSADTERVCGASRRRVRGSARPEAHVGRDSAWVDVSLTGAPVANARQRRGSCLGHRSGVLGERACALASRTLTQEEWKKFLPERPTSRLRG